LRDFLQKETNTAVSAANRSTAKGRETKVTERIASIIKRKATAATEEDDTDDDSRLKRSKLRLKGRGRLMKQNQVFSKEEESSQPESPTPMPNHRTLIGGS